MLVADQGSLLITKCIHLVGFLFDGDDSMCLLTREAFISLLFFIFCVCYEDYKLTSARSFVLKLPFRSWVLFEEMPKRLRYQTCLEIFSIGGAALNPGIYNRV